MSSNSSESSNGGGQGEQPEITRYVTYECAVCGREYDNEDYVCHPPRITRFERRLATGKWLLSANRPPETSYNEGDVVGDDRVSFECLYSTLDPLLDSELHEFDEFFEETPCQVPSLPWVASAYRRALKVTDDELVTGLLAAIRACETRVEEMNGDIVPSDVLAHLVYLDQYGLIPSNRIDRRASLREFCADYYDVGIDDLDSEWLVERRVDRAKVLSTTKSFRQDWDLELVGDVQESHPYSDYKPFNGTSVLADHRDHNLVTRRAKRELLSLPSVDWVTAPHFFYSHLGEEETEEAASADSVVIGFDFAGFEHTYDGQKLQYLGIVTEREENPFEVYLQVKQLSKTHANGIVIMDGRPEIYDFLHFLKTSEFVSTTGILPETRDEYRSIPNVQSLHERVVSQIDLLDGIALIPRRKFLDEGFRTIDDLIPITTYA